MKNKKLNHLLLWVFAILLGLAMNSCGARKAEKSKNSEASKIETSTVANVEKKEEGTIQVIEKKTVNDKNKIRTTETLYRPVDPARPASITTPDGKKHKLDNAEIVIKETEQENNIKTDNSKNTEEFHKSELSELSESGTKTDIKKDAEEIHIDKKAFNPINLLWVLIPLGVVIAFLNKSKIITWANNIWWI